MQPLRAVISPRTSRRPPLLVEQLEDRLVPGETLGALLLLPLQLLPDPGLFAPQSVSVDGPSAGGQTGGPTPAAADQSSLALSADETEPTRLDLGADGRHEAQEGHAALAGLSSTLDRLASSDLRAVAGLSSAFARDASGAADPEQPFAVASPSAAPSGLAPGGPVAGPGGAPAAPVGGGAAATPAAGAPGGAAGPAEASGLVSAAHGAGLSGAAGPQAAPLLHVQPQSSPGPGGYTPAQIRHAYGVDLLSNTGMGQTIAIVDAYNAPHIKSDVAAFSSQFGLPQFNTGGPTLSVVNQSGGSKLPSSNSGWALEISLDVEWAHAIAPQANILLVETSSSSLSSLFTGVNYAANHAHVVSMSWGASEFYGENSYDSYFNRSGVTFTAASGDNGTGVIYPAASPYVLAVGGTTLPLDASGNLTGPETAWSGSGGGISALEGEPGYQANYPIPATGGARGVPDVAYDADPNTGFYVYDTTPYYGQSGWFIVGGTSAGAPQWAALTALANQGRVTAGLGYLASTNLAASAEYRAATGALYAANYNDITAGSNGAYNPPYTTAAPGYDFVTGLGSPHANNLVLSLQTLP
jgi:hypothetical protein